MDEVSAPCAGDCTPVCEACRDNQQLWDPLVVAELVVPSCVVRRLRRSGATDQEDVVDPFPVPDPREPGKVLLVVRVHQRGGFLHLGYEQCASRGLLVWSHVHGTSFMSGVNTCITRSTPSFSLADLGDTAGGASVLERVVLASHCEVAKLTLEVLRRRVLRALPAAMLLDRQSGALCDVTLCANGHDFPAHRLVLAASSDVFRAMFMADFKERTAARVQIACTSAKAFAKFLDFLYADGCPDWEDCHLELLELAEQYQVQRLKKVSQARLWWLPGASALAVLARAGRSPLLAPALLDRLCRQVALALRTLDGSADWRALRADNPYVAGVIDGIASSGGPVTSISFTPA